MKKATVIEKLGKYAQETMQMLVAPDGCVAIICLEFLEEGEVDTHEQTLSADMALPYSTILEFKCLNNVTLFD